MLSSEDEQVPLTRRPPFRGPPATIPFAVRRDGRQSSGSPIPPSGFPSRHSQSHIHHPPGRRASYESESGGSDNGPTAPSADAELRELWDRLDNQRRKVKRLRGDITERRREIRDLGRKKDETDNAFMQIIRPHLTSSQRTAVIPTDVIGKRFGDMQGIRDDYYSVQAALEPLEAEMDREEQELQSLEAELFRLLFDTVGKSHRDSLSARLEIHDWRSRAVGEDGHDRDAPTRSSTPILLLGISRDRHEDIHPLYERLLEATADREDATEHLDELRSHRHEILRGLEIKLHRERVRNNQGNLLSEEELRRLKSSLTVVPADAKTFKARFGVSILPEDLQFLQSFDRQEAKVRKGLEEASKSVEHLRGLCVKKGVMRKHAPYNEEYTIYAGTNRAVLQLDGNMTIDEFANRTGDLTHPKFPILLSNPSHVLDLLSPVEALERAMKLPKDSPTTVNRKIECMKEYGISNLMVKFESKPDYINQWLIHRLRTSPMEAELMLSVAEDTLKIQNLRKWQEEVLYFWRKDAAANLSPRDFHGPMTPKDELDVDDGSELRFNSVAAPSARAKSDDVNFDRPHLSPRWPARSLS